MQKEDNRLFWCDAIRCMAILAVILNHSVEFLVNLNTSQGYLEISDNLRPFILTLFLIGRIAGVPLFLFLSGYLLLNKEICDDQSAKKFYKHNLSGILVTSEAWILILSPAIKYLQPDYSLKQMICGMVMIDQIPYMQFWYVPFIIGVYIGIPFLALCVKHYSSKIIVGIWIISFCIFVVINTLRFIFLGRIIYPVRLESSIFMGGYAFLYLIYGYYFGSRNSKSYNVPVLLMSTVVLFLTSVFLQDYFYMNGQDAKIGYDILPTFLCSCTLFVALKTMIERMENELRPLKSRKLSAFLKGGVEQLSRFSFGAYFLHAIVQDVIRRMKWFCDIGGLRLRIAILFMSSTLITFSALGIIGRNRLFKKILLNQK